MKKISTYLASALLMMVVFTSCSSSSDDKSEEKNGKDAKQENSNASDPAEIDVAQLQEPCDYVDAMEAVVDEVLAIQKSVNGDPSKLTEDDLKRGQALSEKMEELGRAAYEKFGDEEPDCPNNLALQNKMMELR
jgi:hypothetical protein